MEKDVKKRVPTQIERESLAFREGLRMQEIEGNPLSAEDIAMFDMFHREGWSPEKRLNYIHERIARDNQPHAAE